MLWLVRLQQPGAAGQRPCRMPPPRADRNPGRRVALPVSLMPPKANTVAVALAAKLARIVWAVIRSGEKFDMKAATAS